MSKIIRLEAENFKRLKAVEITPDGIAAASCAGLTDAGVPSASTADALHWPMGG